MSDPITIHGVSIWYDAEQGCLCFSERGHMMTESEANEYMLRLMLALVTTQRTEMVASGGVM